MSQWVSIYLDYARLRITRLITRLEWNRSSVLKLWHLSIHLCIIWGVTPGSWLEELSLFLLTSHISQSIIVNSYGQFTPASSDTNLLKYQTNSTRKKLRIDVGRHQRKWQLVKPDAGPRTDSSYVLSEPLNIEQQVSMIRAADETIKLPRPILKDSRHSNVIGGRGAVQPATITLLPPAAAGRLSASVWLLVFVFTRALS